MPGPKLTRRQAGILQNVANQLAQMAVGWELLVNSGALFVGKPTSGVIRIDALRRTDLLNEIPIELGMASYMRRWLDDELQRQGLNDSWLHSAAVDIMYEMAEPELWVKSGMTGVNLVATADIGTDYGSGHATSKNQQMLRRS